MPETSASYEMLKQDLMGLGYVRPGSVVKRYVTCGKVSCRCARGDQYRHGPYFQWTYKFRGKTVSRKLTPTQARLCEQWAAERRRFRKLVKSLEDIALDDTNRILEEVPDSEEG